MKRINKPALVLICFLTIISPCLYSQVDVKLERPPFDQITITDVWKLTLFNTSAESFRIFLSGEMIEKSAGKIYEGITSAFDLPPGMKVIHYNDLSISTKFNRREYEEVIIKTGSVPEGEYSICVSVINFLTNYELGKDCINVIVFQAKKIELILPADESELLTHLPQFNFMLPPYEGGCRLKIVEILPGQTPEESMQRNSAWYIQEEIKSNFYRYPLNAKNLETGKKYAWQIAILSGGIKINESEVWTFSVISSEEEVIPVKLVTPENNQTFPSLESITNNIEFKWQQPVPPPVVQYSYTVKITEVFEKQKAEDAIAQNPPILLVKNLTENSYSYSPAEKKLVAGKTYAWCIIIVLVDRVIPSESRLFHFSTTATAGCGWLTLTDEFTVKSDELNEWLNDWPPTESIPCFVIPGHEADCVWGMTTYCMPLSTWTSCLTDPWPPEDASCLWHPLYERGACWISPPAHGNWFAGEWFSWNSITYPTSKIIRRVFDLEVTVTNVRMYITCDDTVDIYLNSLLTQPLNPHTNPAYVGSHSGFHTLGEISLPDISAGRNELIVVLHNTERSYCGFIYGIESEPYLPPDISGVSPTGRLCSDRDLLRISALLYSEHRRINRDCITLTISSSEGLGGSIEYDSRELEFDEIGTTPGTPLRVQKTLSAIELIRELYGDGILCGTFTVRLRAGNIDCTSFNEMEWSFTIDADFLPPLVEFGNPVLTPHTVSYFVEHSPMTDPPTWDEAEEAAYCIPFPLRSHFEIALGWVSGLTIEETNLHIVFWRQGAEPPYEITSRIIYRPPLSYFIIPTSLGQLLFFDSSSLIDALAAEGITLQNGDELRIMFHFPDRPCICPENYYQNSFKIKLGCE